MRTKKAKKRNQNYLPFAPLAVPVSATVERDLGKRLAKIEGRLSLFEAIVKELLKHVDIYTLK